MMSSAGIRLIQSGEEIGRMSTEEARQASMISRGDILKQLNKP
jgi:hypothetical protein